MTTRTNYAIQKSLDLLYLNQAWAGIGDVTGCPYQFNVLEEGTL